MKHYVDFPHTAGQWSGRHVFDTIKALRAFMRRAERRGAPVNEAKIGHFKTGAP